MPAIKLTPYAAEKPWGRRDLAPWCDVPVDAPVGEMVYTPPGGDDAELLIKALFTSERLSVQVHPGGDAARAAGHRRGKDEAWLILDAAPDSTIGLGLLATLEPGALADAARDGTIEQLLNWRPCATGDIIFAPAGTIHAIGGGITLIEVQQNTDLTYRLFDYGRGRPLHLAEGVAVADPAPWRHAPMPRALGDGRTSLIEGPSFVIERIHAHGRVRLEPAIERPALVVLLDGSGWIDGQRCGSGEVWSIDHACDVGFDRPADLLLTYPGAGILPGAWQPHREGLAA